MFTVGVGGLGLAGYSWYAIRKINKDPEFLAARRAATGSGTSICSPSSPQYSTGDIKSMCKQGKLFEKLQWVGAGIGAVGLVTGTILAIRNGNKKDDSKKRAFHLDGDVNRRGAALRATFAF